MLRATAQNVTKRLPEPIRRSGALSIPSSNTSKFAHQRTAAKHQLEIASFLVIVLPFDLLCNSLQSQRSDVPENPASHGHKTLNLTAVLPVAEMERIAPFVAHLELVIYVMNFIRAVCAKCCLNRDRVMLLTNSNALDRYAVVSELIGCGMHHSL